MSCPFAIDSRIGFAVTSIISGMATRRRLRRVVQTLAAMDDAFLKDIGISRSEIHSAVRYLLRGNELTAG